MENVHTEIKEQLKQKMAFDTPPVRINAGQLAWVFVRYPYDFALTNVRGQVALAQRGM